MKAMKIADVFSKPLEVYTIASEKLEICYNEIDELTKSISRSPHHNAKGRENLKDSNIQSRKK
jgi:hypothetical protein